VAPARFVTDSSLDFLARRLRFLGYDVVTVRGARLEEVLAVARRDGRTVLTLSARRPRHWADVPMIAVPRADAASAVRMLAATYEPSGAPFSRCAECNTALERRHALEAQGEVPGRVLRASPALRHCPGCGKWYWVGTHVRHIRHWLEAALGHALPPDDAPDRAPNAGPPTPPGARG
jgi:uncharacterized protein with PIN domain